MNRRPAQGFTLLECLVALLIVALVVGGSMFQVSQYAQERMALGERFAAHSLAWNRLMDQYQVVQGWQQENAGMTENSGTATEFGRDWRWELESTSTIAENFYRYEVRVYPAGEGERLSSLLVAYFIAEQ